ncbi:MAG TPA: 2-oxoglutarate dehydrogenase E1 component [Planctomycetota bacterium]|nr:2-oxoglutarate dehydrogenase E1 component [Planctomycetota bacterium]
MSETAIDPESSYNLAYVEALYEDYLKDPQSVSADWQTYFSKQGNGTVARGNGNGGRAIAKPASGNGHSATSAPPPAAPRSEAGSALMPGVSARRSASAPPVTSSGNTQLEVATLQHRVDQLIRNYRVRGHIVARVDPLGMQRPEPPELDPRYYRFTERDLDRPFSTENLPGKDEQTLRRIIERLRNTYCRSIGAQFMHIDDLYVREWLQNRMESAQNQYALTRRQQLGILTRLTDAVIFEEFIQKKFIGAKSFSLEGAESLIPLLELAIEKSGENGVDEIVVGMAHRGRLNVLANIIGKSPRQIFREFEDKGPSHSGSGDVKYHLGYSTDWTAASGRKIHVSLCFNPSHLEFVNPVALGRMRAKLDRVGDVELARGMVILIHGDAAFAGEGVVQETLNLSELDGYSTGGTLHVIVNNQIGFTTDASEGRSSIYATDVAKMLQTPIFHVNGEDPDAVAQVVNLALDFRKTFQRDVFIDMYCYRRRGHNESDEAAFTQPLLYRTIEKRKNVRAGYLEHLLKLGGITAQEADEIEFSRREHLERELKFARSSERERSPTVFMGIWGRYLGGKDAAVPDVDTGVPVQRLAELLLKQTKLPENFKPHPKIERLLEHRAQMARGERPLDWAAAEALAFATLAAEGYPVRLSGQDSQRGTFSHRHGVLHDYNTGEIYTPLMNIDEKQAPVEMYNSPLSETGVLGFEYGYSLDRPKGLVMWEAQFGDFANAAQVIIDQFIVSAEVKWKRLSGLVMLLPHGFEGMGPEHSSARLERFMALAAEDNIQIAVPSTPAQFFHLLRRQVIRLLRKPLIVMTPKSLLRHPECVSKLEDLATGTFQRLLPDTIERSGPPRRVLFCSGKIYYELAARRAELKADDTAIYRIEQLYQLNDEALLKALEHIPASTTVRFVQEEPENMGAWPYLRRRYGERFLGKYPLKGVTRAIAASPATGSASVHKQEQQRLLEQAFAD